MVAGWRILTPEDYEALASSGLASLLGIANFYFYFSIDYFNQNALLHPLLHVWSLSLEEQFYLLWPALLIVAVMLKRPIATVIAVFAISLALSYFVTYRDPDLAFYMMPIRIFEFAIGALIVPLVGRISMEGLTGVFVGATGLLMLVTSIYALDSSTPWPGVNALLPCVGTGCLILAGRNRFWTSVLSFSLLRFIGRISYSIYLVHWPLIVLYRTWLVLPPTPTHLAMLFGASIALGWLLFTFVEQVYRVPGNSEQTWPLPLIRRRLASLEIAANQPQKLLRLFFTVPATTACFALTAIWTGGFPHRFDKARVQQHGDELSFAGDLCNNSRSRCAFGDTGSSRIVYLMGDSHALNLVYGLDRLFKNHNIRGIALYDHGCLFLKDTKRFIKGVADQGCAQNVAAAYDQISRDRHPVILAASYDGYVRQVGDSGDAGPYPGIAKDYFEWLEARMKRSLRFIDTNDRPTIIFSRSYDTGVDVAKCQATRGSVAECEPKSLSKATSESEGIDTMINSLRDEFKSLIVIDPKPVFCSSGSCRIQNEGSYFFRDTSHLTNEGSRYLIEQFSVQLLNAISPDRGL